MEIPERPPEVQIPPRAESAQSREAPPSTSSSELSPEIVAAPSAGSQTSNDEGSHAWVVWTVAIIVVGIVLLAVFSSGGSGNSASSYGGGSSSTGGNSSGYRPAPAPVDFQPVSKALDEKNGFKDFHFGMTPDEARAVLRPTLVSPNPGANQEVFTYSGTLVNRIGEFATDTVGLEFFEGHLFRIDIIFSSYPNEIFEALKINYGEPYDGTGWKRGTQSLKAKCWSGEKVFAAIVAPEAGVWDAVVIYDQIPNAKAREYAEKEPDRAARDFSTNGFKTLTMGMGLDGIAGPYTVSESSEVTGIKKIVVTGGDLRTIGFYPLESVQCEFFKDRLFRIDLHFQQNGKEIFKAFQSRFVALEKNDTWTRGSEKLTAKSGGDDRFYGTILAPGGTYGGEEWDTIVLRDGAVHREAEQFKQDAPKRAAKDL